VSSQAAANEQGMISTAARGAGSSKPTRPVPGVVDDGLTAWPERVTDARRQWLEAEAADFELVDGKRLWRDKGSGTLYTQVHGSPLLTIGAPGSEGVSVFFVRDSRLVFLRRADLPVGTSVNHGPVVGYKLADVDVTRRIA
jgi:hypothetical protein